MANGHVLGLPQRGRAIGAGAPQWGTVEAVSTAGSWNVSTLTLATPADDEFWVCAGSQASSSYHYIVGTSQHTTQTGQNISTQHNGTNGWTSARLDLLKPRPGATWNTTVNTNFAGSYHSMSCVRFRYTEGFQIRPYLQAQVYYTDASSSVELTPRTNEGPYPGGVCVAMASHESGFASGMTGISAASEAAGWVGGPYGGALSVLAYYILSTEEIETAPPVTFETVYAPNCWAAASGYIQ
jgi:hypothetical protein